MPAHLATYHLDEYYMSTGNRKIILNDHKDMYEDLSTLEKLVMEEYEDVISMLPRCECGRLKGAYRLGKICPYCGTEVVRPGEVIHPILWIRSFQRGVKFISPHIWAMINNLFPKMSSKGDALRWLSDTSYRIVNPPITLTRAVEVIGERSYIALVNNLDKLLLYLKNLPTNKLPNKREEVEELIDLFNKDKEFIFSDYIPVLNKRLFVVEKVAKSLYTFPVLGDVKDIVKTAIKIQHDIDLRQSMGKDISKLVSKGMSSIISKSVELFNHYVKTKAVSKKGLIRKHIYGTRMFFTIRGVIRSLPTTEDYDVCHMPWKAGPALFRPHLLNLLMNRYGYTYRKATDRIDRSVNEYDPFINQLLQTLIDESPYKGIPILIHRNPTLLPGSMQLLYITKFNKEPENNTIGVPIYILKAPNGDLDGDEMNGILLTDKDMTEIAKNFAPHHNIVALDYYKINGNLFLPPTTVAALANYLKDEEPQDSNCPVFKKLISS